jgi:Neuraminidase (sialidase)
MLYDGATTAGGPQTIWSKRSTDGGATWSARTALSTAGVFSSFPAMESRGAGDVRAFYMQQDGGPDAWNVWYRASTDGGITWSAAVKISDATSGTAYKSAAGFREPYGDYGEAAITNGGKFIGVWGEGDSYTGPGGAWINRQL